MNIYKIVTKKQEKQPFWEDVNLLIVASSYSNAEDKAKNFQQIMGCEIVSINICGEITGKEDVFILRDRF